MQVCKHYTGDERKSSFERELRALCAIDTKRRAGEHAGLELWPTHISHNEDERVLVTTPWAQPLGEGPSKLTSPGRQVHPCGAEQDAQALRQYSMAPQISMAAWA